MSKKLEDIVVVGSGGHAKVIIDSLEKQKIFRIIGLMDDNKELEAEIFGYKILGKIEHIKHLSNRGIVAIGDNWTRSLVVSKILLQYPDFKFINAIHPSANIVRGVKIGHGNAIMGGVIINSDTQIGNHCILNTGCRVDHDNILEDFVTIAPGATLRGDVKVKEYSTISLGANVIHGITIKTQSVVGAGSLVLKDVPEYAVVYGTPTKFIRRRKEGDKYL